MPGTGAAGTCTSWQAQRALGGRRGSLTGAPGTTDGGGAGPGRWIPASPATSASALPPSHGPPRPKPPVPKDRPGLSSRAGLSCCDFRDARPGELRTGTRSRERGGCQPRRCCEVTGHRAGVGGGGGRAGFTLRMDPSGHRRSCLYTLYTTRKTTQVRKARAKKTSTDTCGQRRRQGGRAHAHTRARREARKRGARGD